ncbi:MAG: hemerythrin family protein [Rhodospirillaceae bacterium]
MSGSPGASVIFIDENGGGPGVRLREREGAMGEKLEWKEKYNTGNARIDLEHKVFIGLVQEFLDDAERGVSHDELIVLAHEILKYANFHFYSEERTMSRIGYPEADRHKQLHKALIFELNSRITSLGSGASCYIELANFLVKWFLDHTITEDAKLAASITGQER